MPEDKKKNSAQTRAGAKAVPANAKKKGRAKRIKAKKGEQTKYIEIKRGKRTEPLGERLGYPGGFPVFLDRYVLFGGDEPRAALRFYNGSEACLTGVRFMLTERDKDDRIIAQYSLERRGLNAESGSEFAVADCAVDINCARIEVKLESALSDPYEYIAEGDGAVVRYGIEEQKREYYFKKTNTCRIKKMKRRLGILSVVALTAFCIGVGLVAYRTKLLGEDFGFLSAGGKDYISVTENVEA